MVAGKTYNINQLIRLAMIRTGKTIWEGETKDGKGKTAVSSGAVTGSHHTFSSRMKDNAGANPEELLAAAHSSSYSMALAAELEKAGYFPQQLSTEVEVSIEEKRGKLRIARIDICTEAMVPGIAFSEFLGLAEKAKSSCPLTKALDSVEIVLHATLKIGIIHEIVL
jgi:lipoyl-dependent peroxiredoxin